MNIQRTVHDHAVHQGSERNLEGVQILFAKADSETALRVRIDQQDFLTPAGQSDSEVYCGRCLADAALLVDECDDFGVVHGFTFPFK